MTFSVPFLALNYAFGHPLIHKLCICGNLVILFCINFLCQIQRDFDDLPPNARIPLRDSVLVCFSFLPFINDF